MAPQPPDAHAAAALLDIAREISGTLALPECLQRVCTIARDALAADRSTVTLWSDRRKSMVAAADVGTPPSVYERFRVVSFTRENVPNIERVASGQITVISRTSRDPRARPFLAGLGIASQVIAPLGHRSALGALAVSYEREREIPEAMLSLLDGIAHHAAIAIENAKLFTYTKKAADFRAALGDLALALGREVDPDRIVELVCEKGRAAFEADAALVLVLDHGVLKVSATAGECGAVSRGQIVAPDTPGSAIAEVVRNGQALLVNAWRQSGYGTTTVIRGLSVESVLVAPLLSESRVLGVVLFADSHEPYRFGRVHAEEATILATTAAVGLEHARLVRELRAEGEKLAEHSRILERSNRALADASSELRDLNREMEDLLYIASHDLRAPLINIQGFAHEARTQLGIVRETLTPEAAESLGDIEESLRFVHSSSAKMDSLISALLDVSRISSHDLARKEIDLNSVVQRVLESFEFVIKARGVRLRVGRLPTVLGDLPRLEQVFSNLIDNAIKYLGDGREIEVGAIDGVVPRCFVRDSGVGITAAEMKKVFRLFRRGRVTEVPGEGIGLTLVRKIVERHGGKIWIESAEGQGSTVWFTLPRVLPASVGGS
ncbi:MAG TPA: ATP-binding protein [Candidatus Kryptonia bacterium]|nr:ATP-binding protein [Candidatus Kryptonia bacterium]